MPSFPNQSDVAGTINLSQPDEVRDAVCRILEHRYPDSRIALLHKAFDDIVDAFWGRRPGLLPCDTPYHDLRHSLSAALLMARMVDGYQSGHDRSSPELGADAAMLAVLLALYHDIGFLRHSGEERLNGAELMIGHEQRSVDFVRRYLADTPLAPLCEQAHLIQATNFAQPLDQLLTHLPPDMVVVCQMLGTADLVSQVSGRYYLERCRHYLYDEFVIAGTDRVVTPAGETIRLYASGEDLLRKTPDFVERMVQKRIDDFGAPYKCVAAHFGGENPYQKGMQRNLAFLKELIASNDFSRLQRKPVPLLPPGLAIAADAMP